MRSPVTLDEIDGAGRRMGEVLGPLARPPVIFADYTRALVLFPAETEALARIFRQYNARFERSAIIVSPTSATSVLQMERVIREAENPARRAFRDATDAATWLSEILDDEERMRLQVVLAAASSSPPSRR